MVRNAITLTWIALLIGTAVLLSMGYPSTEAVRLRHSLTHEVAHETDFSWTPDLAPVEFKPEVRAPIGKFVDIANNHRKVTGDHDTHLAIALAGHLAENARDRGPIMADTETTYAKIREGFGYCADFTQTHLALAHAAGLFAREWGFSFDGFGGHGHAVVEVFDRAHSKWRLIDVYNNIHFRDPESDEVLSAETLRARLRSDPSKLKIVRNGPGRLGMPVTEKLLAYYLRGIHHWYLVMGNAVQSYDAHPILRRLSPLGRTAEQAGAIVLGLQPKIRIVSVPENSAARAQLKRTSIVLLGTLAFLVVMAALLVAEYWYRARHRSIQSKR